MTSHRPRQAHRYKRVLLDLVENLQRLLLPPQFLRHHRHHRRRRRRRRRQLPELLLPRLRLLWGPQDFLPRLRLWGPQDFLHHLHQLRQAHQQQGLAEALCWLPSRLVPVCERFRQMIEVRVPLRAMSWVKGGGHRISGYRASHFFFFFFFFGLIFACFALELSI